MWDRNRVESTFSVNKVKDMSGPRSVAQKVVLPRLRGVVFDMDGTLTIPNLDFAAMYAACNVSIQDDLLVAISRMNVNDAATAIAVIEGMEAEARRTLTLAPGVRQFANWLKFYNTPTALVTRNTKETVEHLHSALWEPLGLPRFSPAISRDSPAHVPAKPHPAAMNIVKEAWGLASPLGSPPSSTINNGLLPDVLMVGDSPSNDIEFGKAAGVATALVDSGRRYDEEQQGKLANRYPRPDFYVTNLALLPQLLWKEYTLERKEDSLLKNPPPTPPASRLSVAANNGDLAMVKMEIHSGNICENEAKYINSPLIWAADGGHLECVRALLEAGVDMNKQGYLGATAVSRAARKGHAAVLDLLLSKGADPEIPNLKLQFPLHFAAFNNHEECVRVLLRRNASPWALDRKGRTPAEDTNDERIVQILNSSAGRG